MIWNKIIKLFIVISKNTNIEYKGSHISLLLRLAKSMKYFNLEWFNSFGNLNIQILTQKQNRVLITSLKLYK